MSTTQQDKQPRKIVLAYSGGLDTSVILPWLKERYPGVKLVAFAAELGQGDELKGIEDKAYKSGADEVVIQDLLLEARAIPSIVLGHEACLTPELESEFPTTQAKKSASLDERSRREPERERGADAEQELPRWFFVSRVRGTVAPSVARFTRSRIGWRRHALCLG